MFFFGSIFVSSLKNQTRFQSHSRRDGRTTVFSSFLRASLVLLHSRPANPSSSRRQYSPEQARPLKRSDVIEFTYYFPRIGIRPESVRAAERELFYDDFHVGTYTAIYASRRTTRLNQTPVPYTRVGGEGCVKLPSSIFFTLCIGV